LPGNFCRFGRNGAAEAVRAEVGSCLRLIAAVNVEMKSLEKDIELRAKHDADTALLMTMPGVGSFTALLPKAEIGDFSRFPSPESLASFSGLIASSRSSGGKLKYGNITEQESKYLRWGMIQAAAHIRPSRGNLFHFYERIKTKKGSKVARVALARKMLTAATSIRRQLDADTRDVLDHARADLDQAVPDGRLFRAKPRPTGGYSIAVGRITIDWADRHNTLVAFRRQVRNVPSG
jgi:hypothetical protein